MSKKSFAGVLYRHSIIVYLSLLCRLFENIVIDGGKSKYANPEGRSSTIIDFGDFTTIRIGVCYDQLCEIFLKFNVDLKKNGMAK